MSALLPDYESSEDDEAPAADMPTTVLARRVETAPAVVGAVTTLATRNALPRGEDGRPAREMRTNLPAAIVKARVEGPSRSFGGAFLGVDATLPNVHAGGSVERAAVEAWSFDEQFHSFTARGVAMDAAGGNTLVGTKEALAAAAAREDAPRRKRAKTKATEDLGTEDEHGVWAPEADPDEAEGNETLTQERLEEIAEALKSEKEKNKRGTTENEDLDRRDERKISHLLPARHDRDTEACEPKTAFHGEAEHDYQGRAWTAPPKGMKSRLDDGHDCFIPKRCVHKFTGHGKGVQRVLVFPDYGHLMLSASLDGTCKVWDVLNDKRCLRTYAGHSEAVKDATLEQSGEAFASCGFDRFARVWDVETGQVKHTLLANREMMNCVRFYPRDPNILLAGAGDATSGKIYQFDLRANEIVLQYNHHLAPCNSITYCDADRRFVSTGDDKKIFVWEHNIPVPTKYISEPGMSSTPVVALHPSGQYWCGQSLDNSVVTYTAGEKPCKQLRKKTFRGHLNSGYACGLTFSPNGKFLASGDGEGKLFFWDFKSTRVYRKLQAHDNGPCIGCAWHPLEASWVFTCGWDGMIKLWD
mmetsp:Transcript_3109/g.9085  ORF Transcript_3109/g.9085 Transcript_3109/m.9085 type:complete len:585 (+) Transcript_3109:304-2058(+)